MAMAMTHQLCILALVEVGAQQLADDALLVHPGSIVLKGLMAAYNGRVGALAFFPAHRTGVPTHTVGWATKGNRQAVGRQTSRPFWLV